MKIRILGTAAAEGWPALFCGCDACRKARELGGKNIRCRASILVNDTIKIDLNPDSLHQALVNGLDFSRLEHLLITHSHADHFAPAELAYLADPFAHNRAANPLNIWCSPDVASIIRSHYPDLSRLGAEIHEVTPFESVSLSGLTVTPVTAIHKADELCLNWILGDLGHAVLYASDTGLYESPSWDFLAGVKFDLVVSECTHGYNGQYRTHMSVPDVLEMRRKLEDMGSLNEGCPFVLTHFSHNSLLLHDELQARAGEEGLIVAYDGMQIEAGA